MDNISRGAQILRKELAKEGFEIKHTKLMDMMSRSIGFQSYEDYKKNRVQKAYNFDCEMAFYLETDGFGVRVSGADDEEAKEKAEALLSGAEIAVILPSIDCGESLDIMDLQHYANVIPVSGADCNFIGVYEDRDISINDDEDDEV